MRQFKTWTNNFEKDAVKPKETEYHIQRIEYRNADRVEKTISTQAFQVKRPVTKDYYERKNIKPYGIGESFDDLKTNAAITTVQRENVWHPYYEVVIEEMDFKEKMIEAARVKNMANLGGANVTNLEAQLKQHDADTKLKEQQAKRAE